MLKILIADDHEIVRTGLVWLLKERRDWNVCAEVTDGREAVEKVQALQPDLIIMDIGMPNLNGLEATRQILKINPKAKILILTMHDTDQVLRSVVNVGARGLLLKSDAARDLVAAVECLCHDRTYFTSKVAGMVVDGLMRGKNLPAAPTLKQLTFREREIVQLLAEGKSTKDVAIALNISVKTAETHRSNIMRKLNLHSISELVMFAVKNGIVQVVEPSLASPPVPGSPMVA